MTERFIVAGFEAYTIKRAVIDRAYKRSVSVAQRLRLW
jgi:hypothetical protein